MRGQRCAPPVFGPYNCQHGRSAFPCVGVQVRLDGHVCDVHAVRHATKCVANLPLSLQHAQAIPESDVEEVEFTHSTAPSPNEKKPRGCVAICNPSAKTASQWTAEEGTMAGPLKKDARTHTDALCVVWFVSHASDAAVISSYKPLRIPGI